MMWERVREIVDEGGGRVEMGAETVRLLRQGDRISRLEVRRGGEEVEVVGRNYISTHAARRTDPADRPAAARGGAARGRGPDVPRLPDRRRSSSVGRAFPDNWIYVHDPGVGSAASRTSATGARPWCPTPAPSASGSSTSASRATSSGRLTDDQLVALASPGAGAGSAWRDPRDVRGGRGDPPGQGLPGLRRDIPRQPRRRAGLRSRRSRTSRRVGRNGMHRYNNQDHSMLTAMLAVRNLMGESHDLWKVNTERSYYEQFVARDLPPPGRTAMEPAAVSGFG